MFKKEIVYGKAQPEVYNLRTPEQLTEEMLELMGRQDDEQLRASTLQMFKDAENKQLNDRFETIVIDMDANRIEAIGGICKK